MTRHVKLDEARRPWRYRLVRVLETIRIYRMDTMAKKAEILVLRHQFAVLQRQITRALFHLVGPSAHW